MPARRAWGQRSPAGLSSAGVDADPPRGSGARKGDGREPPAVARSRASGASGLGLDRVPASPGHPLDRPTATDYAGVSVECRRWSCHRLARALDGLTQSILVGAGGLFPYFAVATLVVTAAVAALALHATWWLLAPAFLVHLVVTCFLLDLVVRVLGSADENGARLPP